MAITLSPEEIDRFLGEELTAILTTIRRDGRPLSVPMWFLYLDGALYFRTPQHSAKVGHLRRDPRVCCLVETGTRYLELKAVVIDGEAKWVEDAAELARFRAGYDAKYEGRRPATLPGRIQAHYDRGWLFFKVIPRRIKTWDNGKIRYKADQGDGGATG